MRVRDELGIGSAAHQHHHLRRVDIGQQLLHRIEELRETFVLGLRCAKVHIPAAFLLRLIELIDEFRPEMLVVDTTDKCRFILP